jgi:RNA polymerase sigma-70 factor (ECF subfamily)
MLKKGHFVLENEPNVILDWKKGNKKAYETLVRHYMTDAYLVAYGFVGNSEDARDLSQDAFIKAYQARERFDSERPFYPWLYRIIKNHCLNFIKRGRRGQSLYYEDSPDRERFASNSPTPLESLEKNERHAALRVAVDELSDDHREIIVLKNFRDLSYQRIAEVLEIPIGTVMSRLYYARKTLKDIIERLEREGLPEQVPALTDLSPAAGEVA